MAAEDFDDGRTDVPGGVAGAVERVLVVGAGIAGLAVANALTHAGVECVVLEGRDRADGRLHTVDLGGSPVDLGGSWIHMPDGNPLSAIARLAGVSCASADPVPEMAGFDCAEGRRLTEVEAADLVGLYLGGFPQAAEGLLADLGAAASMDGAIEAFVAAAGLAPGPARRARQMLYAGIEAESAGPAGQAVPAVDVERTGIRRDSTPSAAGRSWSSSFSTARPSAWRAPMRASRFAGRLACSARRSAARVRSRPRLPSPRGRATHGRGARTRTSRRGPAQLTPTCSANRSAGASCSRASTRRARASPTLTAR